MPPSSDGKEGTEDESAGLSDGCHACRVPEGAEGAAEEGFQGCMVPAGAEGAGVEAFAAWEEGADGSADMFGS